MVDTSDRSRNAVYKWKRLEILGCRKAEKPSCATRARHPTPRRSHQEFWKRWTQYNHWIPSVQSYFCQINDLPRRPPSSSPHEHHVRFLFHSNILNHSLLYWKALIPKRANPLSIDWLFHAKLCFIILKRDLRIQVESLDQWE